MQDAAIDLNNVLKERGRGRPPGYQPLSKRLNDYFAGRKQDSYIACEELDFTWSRAQLTEIVQMWKTGIPVDFIARNFDRSDEEVAIIIMDLAMHGVIQDRPGGVRGRGQNDGNHR